MKKTVIIALALIVCGAAIMFGAFAAKGFDFKAFSTVKYEGFEYECSEAIREIEIDEGERDVTIQKSADSLCRVEYFITGKDSYTIEEDNGVLRISHDADSREWFSLSFGEIPALTIFLPEGEYERLYARSGSGDVVICSGIAFVEADIATASGEIELNADVQKLEISAASGEISISGCTLGEVAATTSSGDIEAEKADMGAARFETASGSVDIDRVKLEGALEVSTDSGEVELEYVEAASISVATSSGNVEGTIETPMCYDVDTSSGKVRVPASATDGAPCHIKTASGDVEIDTED